MKMKMRKVLGIALAAMMLVSLFAINASAAGEITINPNNPEGTAVPTYDYYVMMKASVSGEKVSYYVENETLATALDGLTIDGADVFTVTKATGANRWNVVVNEKPATTDPVTGEPVAARAFTGEELAAALFTIKGNAIDSGTATGAEGATTRTISLGYDAYVLIDSSLGTKYIVDTFKTETVNEKNTYPSADKELTQPTVDGNVQIGDVVSYTLTIPVPASVDPNKDIVLTDTMSAGLTFKAVTSCTVPGAEEGADPVAVPNTVSAVNTTDNSFTITITGANAAANAGKTITIIYTATVNASAIDGTTLNPITNTVKLKYGNDYEANPDTVTSQTYQFEVLKYDGADKSDTPANLAGAVFEVQSGSSAAALNLVYIDATHYRIATAAEVTAATAEGGSGIKDFTVENTTATAGDVCKNFITVDSGNIVIQGVDADVTYTLVETKEPTGFNRLTEGVPVKATATPGEGANAVTTYAFATAKIANNSGTELPSTGGIGTTMFYVVGGVLVAAAVVILVSKKRAGLD